MRIIASYCGSERIRETSDTEIVFGRGKDDSAVFLNLSPDQKVSRVHGRIWEEGGVYWIEDLSSTRGTQLNGAEIKGKGKCQCRIGDVISVGETTLRLETPGVLYAMKTNYLEQGTVLLPETRPPERPSGISVAGDVAGSILDAFAAMAGSGNQTTASLSGGISTEAKEPARVSIEAAKEQAAQRLKVLCDLPLRFAGKTDLEALLRLIVDRLVELIPNGQSWGVVLRELKTDSLLLKAYRAAGVCSVSEILARRAVNARKPFIWKRSTEESSDGSHLAGPIAASIYAPLIWQDETLGVLCIDSHQSDTVFTEDDLRVTVVVAQYAAMAVATHQLQEKLKQESATMANLLRQFSPAVAERLLAHRGRLRLGGERNEVTLLCSDIRGFTRMVADMEPDDVVETLNDYFGCLVPIIFANHGTIDKFIGDGILAVFGTVERDPVHHEQAIRAALEMQAAMPNLNASRKARGVPTGEIGIGVHCGEVIQGFVGTDNRMEYTVIGDVVNRTSRYCAGAAGGEVLISPELHERVWRIVEAEETTIQPKHEPELRAFRIRSPKASRDQ
ncbi:MAG TPA: adenylate/guanylate cyclase domain-containing protein [Terriglobales bacterium]|nr:adenylate/guanylate cyclase domain-containing protein [Terriglobales bacterium]